MLNDLNFNVTPLNYSRERDVDDGGPNGIIIKGYFVLLCLASCVCLLCNVLHLHVLRKFDGLTVSNLIIQRYGGIVNIVMASSFALMTPVMINDQWLLRETYCISCGLVLSYAHFASAMLLGLLELDRFCAVVTPYRYAHLATRRNAHISVLTHILLGGVPFTVIVAIKGIYVISEINIRICFYRVQDVFPYRVGQALVFSFSGAAPLLLITMVYGWLLLVTYRQSRRILAQKRAVRTDGQARNDQGFVERIQHIQKASRALAVTLAAYFVFWGPLCIRLYLLVSDVPVPYWFNMICFLFLLGSTMMNIIILSICKSKYRLALSSTIVKFIHILELFRRNRIGFHVET